jgi:hypothetical protein
MAIKRRKSLDFIDYSPCAMAADQSRSSEGYNWTAVRLVA